MKHPRKKCTEVPDKRDVAEQAPKYTQKKNPRANLKNCVAQAKEHG